MPPNGVNNGRIDPYGIDDAITRHLDRLRNGHGRDRRSGRPTRKLRCSKEAREAIISFVSAKKLEVSKLRIRTYLSWLPSIAERLGADFLEPRRETPQKFIDLYADRVEVNSLDTAANVVMKFWRWRFEQRGEELPTWLRIKVSTRNANHKGPQDVITSAEVLAMVEHASTLRDKAFIWTLYESGCRIGELLQLQLRHIERTESGIVRLHVDGKTGPRPVPLFREAVPSLLAWIENHPRKGEPDAPLWVGLDSGRWGEPIVYQAMAKVLKTIAKRAGIRKRIHPHLFRHTRATELAKDPQISTAVGEQLLGWVPGSKVARVYQHLSGRDVEAALMKKYGMIEQKEQTLPAPPRLPRACGRCRTVNEPDARFCRMCGGAVEVAVVMSLEEKRELAEMLAEILDHPQVEGLVTKLLAQRFRREGRAASATNQQGGEPLPLSP